MVIVGRLLDRILTIFTIAIASDSETVIVILVPTGRGRVISGRSDTGRRVLRLVNVAANNRRRKTYSAIYTMQQLLDYYRANPRVVSDAIKESVQLQKSNTGRIVFRGSYDLAPFPAPPLGGAPPPLEPPEGSLDPPPCGYLLTDEQ